MATTVQLTDDSESYTVADPTGETVFAGAGDDTITGGDGNDVIFGEDGNDQVFAGLGDDSVSGANGDDLIFGELGNDALSGGEGLDQMLGGLGNDSLDGGNGVDTLVGEQDNDRLTGGAGADIFQFGFSMTSGATETFTGWLEQQGLPTSGWTQSFFASNYTAYLQHLVETYHLGVDANGDGAIGIGLNQNDPYGTPLIEGLSTEQLESMFGDRECVDVVTGKKFQLRWYSDSFSTGDTQAVTSTDGHDVITDFDFSADGDKLSITGVGTDFTLAQFEEAFSFHEVDTNGDGAADSTVLALADGSWDVTLIGVTGHTDEADFYAVAVFPG